MDIRGKKTNRVWKYFGFHKIGEGTPLPPQPTKDNLDMSKAAAFAEKNMHIKVGNRRFLSHLR